MINPIPYLTAVATALFPVAAQAHPGHVTDGAHGHDHWLALAILGGLAFAGVAWFAWRGLRRAGPGKART